MNLLSFCVSPGGSGKCLRAPRFASVGFEHNIVERTQGRSTTGGTASAAVIARFCFLLLDQWFSLQSRCVQWSGGSAEGSVVPSNDGQEQNNWRVYKGSYRIFSFGDFALCIGLFFLVSDYVLKIVLINK